MKRSAWIPGLFGLLLAALAGLPGRPGAAAVPPAPPPAPSADTLTAAQRKEVVDLLATFKRSRKAPAERTKVVDRILEIGGGAPALLVDAITRELQPARDHYRVAYAKRLAQVMASMARSGELKDVETLRQNVLALSWRREPTKEEIAATADSAMARLNDLLLPAAAVILKSDSGLWNERNDLVELGTNGQRASDAAAKAAAKPDAPAPAPAKFEGILADQERLAALVVLTKEESGQKVLVANEALEAALDPEEARCIRDLNRVRVLLGLGPLRIDPGLCSAARDHSMDMVKLKFFSHDSPVAGKRNFQDRARKFGSTANGENIAEGQPTGAAVNQDWFHSPGHHLNMMNRHWSRVGVGRFEKTWTEMFG